MKQNLHEQLSALVDDELPSAEQELLIKQLAGDTDLSQRLARYQLISDAMQNHLPQCVDPDFRIRVQGALPDAAGNHATAGLAAFIKPLAGLAMAASVAVVAVLSVQAFRQESASGVPAVASAPAASDYIRANGSTDPAQVRIVRADKALDVYLVNHNEFAGSRGMLPYARLVGEGMNTGNKE